MAKDTKISDGDLSYICARNRQHAYNIVVSALKRSGLTQAELARRLGMRTDSLSRLLKMPQNWELNTFSKLYYGIIGAALQFAPDYPYAEAPSHYAEGTVPATRDQSVKLRVITEDEPTYIPMINTEAGSRKTADQDTLGRPEYAAI
jgi:transcriptional regulator with XRE-family HTH domain